MKNIKKKFQNEIIILKEMITKAEKRLNSAPKGQLKIQGTSSKIMYYYKDANSKDNYKYIKKSEQQLAKDSAQRDYDEKLVKLANERIKLLNNFCEKEDNC